MKVIKLENISREYGKENAVIKALEDVSFTIEKGKFVAIMGASGSGKSTLLNILGGMDTATSGNYFYDDIEVTKLTNKGLHQFRRDRVAFIFQQYELIQNYTIYENVELPLRAKNIPKKERKERIQAILEELNIWHLKDKVPSTNSGGEQQRAAIARAIASQNDLILADEPTGALDSKTGLEIMELLKKLHDMGKTIVVVTHDKTVASYADEILYVADGKIVENEERI